MDIDRIKEISQGNPGALSVTVQAAKRHGSALDAIERAGLKGSKIWERYKDECGQDIDRFLGSIGLS